MGNCTAPCDLSVSRGCSGAVCSTTRDRRIGFRKGYVDGVQPFGDFSLPGTGTEVAQNTGIINCPTPATCPAFTTDYNFKIERIARGTVYARYYFELTFPSDGDWVVFFEGCCRVPSCQPGGTCETGGAITGVANNAGLPFHIRTALRAGDNPSLPTSSFRFETPDLVVLR
jgi:hypothetical protein